MALNSEIKRWLVVGILGSTCLMMAQLYWLLQSRELSINGIIRNWKLDKRDKLTKRVIIQRELTTQDSEVMLQQNSTLMKSLSEKIVRQFDLQSCIPDSRIFSQNIETPFKIFIYDLPKKFNYDIVKCVEKYDCFDLDYCGFGNQLYKIGNISVRNTNQFSLEVVLHHQLLSSPYRVLDPSKADVLYIPAYTGLSCFCKDQETNSSTTLVTHLYDWLEQQKQPYLKNKLVISALGKIEREQTSSRCPLLTFKQSKTIIYATIEEESNISHQRYLKIDNQKVIPVPYPSYGHLIVDNKTDETLFKTPSYEQRRVSILLAAGPRRSNYFRNKIMDQFQNGSRTKLSFEKFYSIADNSEKDMVLLYTQECRGDHMFTTIPWMQHSVFCLEPPGDSPTRKSFYDAIIAGCIPVIFTGRNPVNYPFQRQLNYTEFTVTLKSYHIEEKHIPVRQLLSEITTDEIKQKLNAVQKVAKYLQYSLPNGKYLQSGALELFLNEIEEILKSEKLVNTNL